MKDFRKIKNCYNNICRLYDTQEQSPNSIKLSIKGMILGIDNSLSTEERDRVCNKAYESLTSSIRDAEKTVHLLTNGMEKRKFNKLEEKVNKLTQTHHTSRTILNAFQGMCHEIAMFFRKVMKKPTIADQVEQAVEKLVREVHPTLAMKVKKKAKEGLVVAGNLTNELGRDIRTKGQAAKAAIKSAAHTVAEKGRSVGKRIKQAVTPKPKGVKTPSLSK